MREAPFMSYAPGPFKVSSSTSMGMREVFQEARPYRCAPARAETGPIVCAAGAARSRPPLLPRPFLIRTRNPSSRSASARRPAPGAGSPAPPKEIPRRQALPGRRPVLPARFNLVTEIADELIVHGANRFTDVSSGWIERRTSCPGEPAESIALWDGHSCPSPSDRNVRPTA